ncbi:hypothetical protein DFAR_1540013 [Desulfarculales bacterium]
MAMSTSFVSRQIMERLDDTLPGHLYRRISDHPRNPKFQAEGLELELLSYFSARTPKPQAGPTCAAWNKRRCSSKPGQSVFRGLLPALPRQLSTSLPRDASHVQRRA